MSTQEVFVQHFAKLFNHYQEALATPETSESVPSATSCSLTPLEERNRMVAAARLALLELETNSPLEDESRKYFAKPGEAEWGC